MAARKNAGHHRRHDPDRGLLVGMAQEDEEGGHQHDARRRWPWSPGSPTPSRFQVIRWAVV